MKFQFLLNEILSKIIFYRIQQVLLLMKFHHKLKVQHLRWQLKKEIRKLLKFF